MKNTTTTSASTQHDLPVTLQPSATPPPTPSPGPIRSPAGLLPVVGMEKTSAAFREKVIRMAGDLGTDPNYLMAIMSFESGFDPSARNPDSGATGLIQFTVLTARELGTTTEVLARMSAEQQLDYVARYFAPFNGRLRTLEDAYMAVLYRAAVGSSPEHVLFLAGDPDTGIAYVQNSALDINKDRRITVAEATSFVQKRFIADSRSFEFGAFPLSGEEGSGFAELGQKLSASPSSDLPSAIEGGMVRSAVRSGTRDEDSLTDLVFFQRHPERNGRAISHSEPDFQRLSQEWLSIRDTLVRPILLGPTPAPAQPSPGVGEPDIVSVRGVFKVARQIAPQVEALLAVAEADGIKLGCASSYRPIEEQIRLRKQNCGPTDYDIWQKPSEQCTTPTARPKHVKPRERPRNRLHLQRQVNDPRRSRFPLACCQCCSFRSPKFSERSMALVGGWPLSL